MSDFSDKFLREGKKLFSPKPGPSVNLGAFGKHPAWDDHMEELGLETESLLLVREIFYVEGIGGQINSGEWEKLDEAQRLPGFKHLFVWKRGESLLLGRMWSSSDGKGRSRYPMIACAHCHGIPLATAERKILPVLEEFERRCKAAKSADGVREAWSLCSKSLKSLMASEVGESSHPNGREAAFLEKLCPGGDDEKFLRILYRLHAQCPEDAFKADSDWDECTVRIRVPALAEFVVESLLFWNYFFESQFRAPIPILTTMPLGEPWIDVLIGKPTPNSYYPLLARPEIFAIASDVAYEIEGNFREEMADSLKRIRNETGWSTGKSAVPPEKRSWIQRLLPPD